MVPIEIITTVGISAFVGAIVGVAVIAFFVKLIEKKNKESDQ